MGIFNLQNQQAAFKGGLFIEHQGWLTRTVFLHILLTQFDSLYVLLVPLAFRCAFPYLLVKTQILTNSIGLEAAALQIGVSPKTLKRKLTSMKTTYSEIIDQVRMQLAKLKQEESSVPIHMIANELGYKHQANFTRAFKRMCGIAPLDYRNKHQV